MAGENADEVESDTVLGNNLQSFEDLRTDNPVGVGLDINQVPNADEPRLVADFVQQFVDPCRPVQRYPADYTSDPGIGVSVIQKGAVLGFAIGRFHRYRRVDAGCAQLWKEIIRPE